MTLKLFRRGLWALTGVAAIGLFWLLLWTDNRADPSQTGAEPAFRADFELTDHQGSLRSEEDFAGQWMLIFFGFANCPDVCPMTLAEIAFVMDSLGVNAGQIQPLFVSIDPERDTPSALAEFVPRFDAGIIGLTGTPDQVKRTSETFKIFYEKIEQASAPNGYTMGHSSQLFLFDPEAGFLTSWAYGTPAEEILADLREQITG